MKMNGVLKMKKHIEAYFWKIIVYLLVAQHNVSTHEGAGAVHCLKVVLAINVAIPFFSLHNISLP